MQARAFRLLGSTQLAFLREQLAGVVAAWAGEWLAQGMPALALQPADQVPLLSGSWISLARGRAACHVLREPGQAERWLFGAVALQQPSALAAEAAEAALVDLARRCLPGDAAPLAAQQAPPAAEWQRGAGALLLRLDTPAGTLQLLLDGASTEHWLALRPRPKRPPAPRLHELRGAVGAGRLRLQASVGQAEIDIGTLQSLAVGDVIPLDLRIDQPLRLVIAGQAVVQQRAYLGLLAGRRAIRLTTGADNPRTPDPKRDP